MREASGRQLAQAQARVPAARREVALLAAGTVAEAKRLSLAHVEQSRLLARRVAGRWGERVRADRDAVAASAGRAVKAAAVSCKAVREAVATGADTTVGRARTDADGALTDIRVGAGRTLADATRTVRTALHDGLAPDVDRALQAAARASADLHGLIAARAAALARQGRVATDDAMATVADEARRTVAAAAQAAAALMREVAGQGPEKTLQRGFVVARGAGGEPVTSAVQAAGQATLALQFKDGTVGAAVQTTDEERA